MKKSILVIPVILLGGLAACALPHPKDHLKFSGTLEMTEYSLGANLPGRLSTLNVDEGDEVKKGDELAALEHYDQAKKDHERLVQLQSVDGASLQDVEHAAQYLNDLKVVSPVDGVVLVKIREAGETLAAGNPVVIVGDRKDMWVKIHIPEGNINLVTMGQPAKISLDGIKETFKGHVSFIAPQAKFTPRNIQTPEERITQTFAVKIKLEAPPNFLRPGVAADVHLGSQK